jgi:hypothetical protein
MIYEGIKQHGTIVLLPSGALSSMSLSGVLEDLARGKPLGASGLPGAAAGEGEQGAST